jgi:hypothetical protein
MKKFYKGLMIAVAALFLAACASTPANPFVGGWDVTIDTPVGVLNAAIDITPDLAGTMSSGEMGSATLTGVTVEENAVSFQTTIDAQGQSLTLRFSGTIDGDSLAGNFDTDFGAIAVTGVRR